MTTNGLNVVLAENYKATEFTGVTICHKNKNSHVRYSGSISMVPFTPSLGGMFTERKVKKLTDKKEYGFVVSSDRIRKEDYCVRNPSLAVPDP
ncbi:hypothetical protein E2C01_023715 [Portunus trituberculatus]|uniref:Uncharacterized protein n=1 Tax=Portunus trituberculatus TaxID=210409 RepID=A0A5B7E9V8_PORTR|nr:hypothetical protein [Portunus trituberculatus]